MNNNDLLPRIHQIVREINANASERGLNFKIECSHQRVPAFCDHEKISQVIRNLLFNAIKFSYKNTLICIQCKEVDIETENPKQQISISNHGVPIPEKELDIIFDKFTQSSSTNTGAGGTGLGLAISKQILRDHNSIIWAENGDNDTITFSFLLPVTVNNPEK